MAAEVFTWKIGYPALISPKALVIQPKRQHFQIRACKLSRFMGPSSIQTESGRIEQCTPRKSYPLLVGRNPHYPTATGSVDDDYDLEPFWSSTIKQAYRAVKSLFQFLAEQPGQLKYIEWPSLQSTLKTATLTLLLVGLLIIALSSVDAALYYIFAVLSRRHA